MKMILFVATLFLGICFSQSCSADPVSSGDDGADTGLIYGSDHSYFLTAPTGWVLDNQSGVPQGLYAVFYPKGSSWQKGVAVMYTTDVSKQPADETLADFVKNDVARFRKESPGVMISEEPKIKTKDEKREATVRSFQHDDHGNYESVAYIQESKVFVLICLTAKTEKDWQNAKGAFASLVQSYQFLTTHVKEEK